MPRTSAGAICKNLTIGGTVSATLFVVKNFIVTGNTVVNSNGTISQGKATLTLRGNLASTGIYTTTNNAANVAFGGITQSLSGTFIFRRLTINSGTSVFLSNAIRTNAAFAVNGKFNPGINLVTVAGALTVGASGLLKVEAANYAANYTANPGTITAGGTVEYISAAAQLVSNGFTYSVLKISGAGTRTLAGNLLFGTASATFGSFLIGDTSVLDMGNFTANRGSLGGVLSIGNLSTLRIGAGSATTNFPTNFTSTNINTTSTVEYYGAGTQVVSARTYGHLTLTSSGGAASAKTMPSTPFSISGNFNSSIGAGSSVSYIAGNNITFSGRVNIGAGTSFNTSTFSHTITGNLTNNGTITSSTSTVTLNGSGSALTGAGSNGFNNLTISASNNTAAAATNITVAGVLNVTGSFTHISGSTGTITMSGATGTVAGTDIIFNNISCTGTIATAVGFIVAGNFTVAGSFTQSAGTVTLSGSGKSILGAGTKSFYGLFASGTISTGVNATITNLLNVSPAGSFTGTAGTTFFSGSTLLNGSANLFNATVSSGTLALSGNAILGVAGALTLTGSLNTTSTIPNTVSFNGAGQSINSTIYHNLITFGSGLKTATGALTINGNLTIGNATTLEALNFSHTISGNWVNNGNFTSGSSTIVANGITDAIFGGAVTSPFNVLTINKAASTNVVTLGNSITAQTLNMTQGSINTGSNVMTITTTRTGSGIILGNIRRTHSFVAGTEYFFEGLSNSISFNAANSVSSILVNVTKAAAPDFPTGINRFYTTTVTGTFPASSATLKLHYDDGADLAGNIEASLNTWNYNGSIWVLNNSGTNITRDATANFVSQSNLTVLSNRWSLSDGASVINWTGASGTAWNIASNWSSNSVPTSTDIVQIGVTGFTNQPTISSTQSVRSVIFGSAASATLTINAAGSLTTTGNISGIWSANQTHTINAGNQNITVGSDLILSDGIAGHTINLNAGSGNIAVNGSLTQSGNAGINFSGAGNLSINGDFNYSSSVNFIPGSSTVSYNGTVAQAIAGIPYYHLTINKLSGIATANSALSVGGNINVMAGEMDLNNALTITGDLSISAGASFRNFNTITIAGHWINNGAFTGSGSTTIFNGTGVQNVGNTTFNGIIINKASGTVVVTSAISVKADVSVLSGSLDVSASTLSPVTLGNTFSLADGTTLLVGGPSNFPANFSNYNLASSSTVNYNGGIQTVFPVTYGNLTLSNLGAKTLAANTDVMGNLSIANNATFNGSSFILDLYGNWQNNGTFTPATSTVLFEGLSKTITGATTFYIGTFYGSYTVNDNVTFINRFRVVTNAVFNVTNPAVTLTLDGDYTNNGSVLNAGTITFSGTVAQAIATRFALASSFGTVNFNGTVSPAFTSNTTTTAANWNINNTGGITPSSNWNSTATFVIAGNAAFNAGAYTHTFTGSFTNNGITNSAGGELNFVPAAAQTVLLSGNSFSSSGTVTFGGAGALTVTGIPTSLNNVVIANSIGVSPAADWAMGQNFTITNGAVFNAGSNNYTVGGDLTSNGTLNGGTSTFVLTSGTAQLSASSVTWFNHFVINAGATLTANTDYNLSGNFSNNGIYDAVNSLGALVMSGSTPATLGGSTSPSTIPAINIMKTGGAVVTLTTPVSFVTALDITSGIFDIADMRVRQDSTDFPTTALSAVLTIANDGTLRIGGTTTKIPSFATYALDSNSTVDYYGTNQLLIDQTNSNVLVNFGNLTISGGNQKTVSAAMTIRKNFTITAGGFTAGNFTHNVGGNWTMTGGTLTATGSTINFNGTGTQTISSISAFNNLSVSKVTGTLALSSAVTISNILGFGSDVSFPNSDLQLLGNNLTLGNPVSNATGINYIIADGAGSVIQNITTGSTKTFPVGTATAYLPATIALTTGAADNFSVRVIGTAFIYGTSGPAQTTTVVNATWEIAEDVVGGTTNASLTLQWPQPLELIFDRSMAKLAQFTGGAWNYGATIPASGSDPYMITRSGLNAFSPFSVRMDNTVLPVVWLRVSAKRTGNNNLVQWSTASETNNASFEVQASQNGINFSTIGSRAGAITSTNINYYDFLHTGVADPLTYYRIKQTDAGGRVSYSIVVKVGTSVTVLQPVLTVNNPVYSQALISFTAVTAARIQLTLTDAAGHIIEARKISIAEGINTFAINMAGKAAGIYFLRLADDMGHIYVKQLVKE